MAEVNIPGGSRLFGQLAISLSTDENRASQGRRLVVESERRPALEVGGDFFQIIPYPIDGSRLIAAGEVTGKGLKACWWRFW
jgi:hypothetical protein